MFGIRASMNPAHVCRIMSLTRFRSTREEHSSLEQGQWRSPTTLYIRSRHADCFRKRPMLRPGMSACALRRALRSRGTLAGGLNSLNRNCFRALRADLLVEPGFAPEQRLARKNAHRILRHNGDIVTRCVGAAGSAWSWPRKEDLIKCAATCGQIGVRRLQDHYDNEGSRTRLAEPRHYGRTADYHLPVRRPASASVATSNLFGPHPTASRVRERR